MKVFYNVETPNDTDKKAGVIGYLGFIIDTTTCRTGRAQRNDIMQLYKDAHDAGTEIEITEGYNTYLVVSEEKWVSNMEKRGWTVEKKPKMHVFDLDDFDLEGNPKYPWVAKEDRR